MIGLGLGLRVRYSASSRQRRRNIRSRDQFSLRHLHYYGSLISVAKICCSFTVSFFGTNLREDWNSGHWVTSCPHCHPTWIHLSVHFFPYRVENRFELGVFELRVDLVIPNATNIAPVLDSFTSILILVNTSSDPKGLPQVWSAGFEPLPSGQSRRRWSMSFYFQIVRIVDTISGRRSLPDLGERRRRQQQRWRRRRRRERKLIFCRFKMNAD